MSTTSRLVIVGAVLPVVLGATLGSMTTTSGRGTWAYPMPASAFLALSLGLVASHALVALAYLEVRRGNAGAVAATALSGAVGSLLLAGCELWSGLVATTPLDSPVLTVLDAAYAVSAVAVLVSTLGCGAALRAAGSPLAAPLLLNGIVLLVAIPVRFLAGDVWGVAALTLWSLTYVWVALRLGGRRRTGTRAATLTA